MHPSQGAALHHIGKAHTAEVVGTRSAAAGEEVQRAKNEDGGEPSGPGTAAQASAELGTQLLSSGRSSWTAASNDNYVEVSSPSDCCNEPSGP